MRARLPQGSLTALTTRPVKLVSLDRERGSFSVEDAVDLVTQHWGHRSDLGMVAVFCEGCTPRECHEISPAMRTSEDR